MAAWTPRRGLCRSRWEQAAWIRGEAARRSEVSRFGFGFGSRDCGFGRAASPGRRRRVNVTCCGRS